MGVGEGETLAVGEGLIVVVFTGVVDGARVEVTEGVAAVDCTGVDEEDELQAVITVDNAISKNIAIP